MGTSFTPTVWEPRPPDRDPAGIVVDTAGVVVDTAAVVVDAGPPG
jgi:hypothetical protein